MEENNVSEFNQEIVSRVKLHRQSMDKMLSDLRSTQKRMHQNEGTREMSLALTKLEEARMWLGALQGAVGHTLPPDFADKYERQL